MGQDELLWMMIVEVAHNLGILIFLLYSSYILINIILLINTIPLIDTILLINTRYNVILSVMSNSQKWQQQSEFVKDVHVKHLATFLWSNQPTNTSCTRCTCIYYII